MLRQGRLIAVVGTFLIGCAVLLVVGCSGVRSGATKKEQTRSAEATAVEQARCQGTRTIKRYGVSWRTNDVPGCPKGGLLLGTNKADKLYGGDGDDKIRGLGGSDEFDGGPGDDVLYGGDGHDDLYPGRTGKDIIYGGDGNDVLFSGLVATMSSGTSSIVAKARTYMTQSLGRTTMWTAVARRKW